MTVRVYCDEQIDGGKQEFGSDKDYWWVYNGTDTRLELWAKNSDGSNTNAKVFMVEDGTDDGVFCAGCGKVEGTLGINFDDMRVFDATNTLLPVTGSNDDIGLVPGTPGTSAPSLQTADEGGTGSEQHHYAAFNFVVPDWYVAGGTITVRCHGGMLAVADQASTTVIDLQAWVCDYTNGDLTVSSDLCTTAAITAINSTTFANHDFTIDDDVTGHVLAPGSVVQCKLRMTVDDNGNAADNITMVVDKISVLFTA